jgi:ubiquinone/menaquinone biosynthesis C-methylase UbiE
MSYTAFDRFVAWQRFRAAVAHVRPGSRVCDVGCGLNAAFLRYANTLISFGVGLDYQRFRSGDPSAPAVVQCDLTRDLPLQSTSFDHAVMLAVLEHIESPRPMLAELFRILCPGGSLIMSWPNAIVDPLLNILHAVGMVSGEMESDKHQPRIPVDDLMTMLKEIGFKQFKHLTFELGMNNLLVSWKP